MVSGSLLLIGQDKYLKIIIMPKVVLRQQGAKWRDEIPCQPPTCTTLLSTFGPNICCDTFRPVTKKRRATAYIAFEMCAEHVVVVRNQITVPSAPGVSAISDTVYTVSTSLCFCLSMYSDVCVGCRS